MVAEAEFMSVRLKTHARRIYELVCRFIADGRFVPDVARFTTPNGHREGGGLRPWWGGGHRVGV
ncbi:MAG: hypothetical protein WCO57_16295 [Verrucomicrobiota bacterium]